MESLCQYQYQSCRFWVRCLGLAVPGGPQINRKVCFQKCTIQNLPGISLFSVDQSPIFFYKSCECLRSWPSGSEINIFAVISSPIHRKKKDREFPVPSREVTTKLSLGGNNDVITELFPPNGSLVSDIPAGDGKLVNLFYGVWRQKCIISGKS